MVRVAAQAPTYPISATVISQDGLNVRNAPSPSSPVIQLIPYATALSVTGPPTSDGWYSVALGSLSGWAMGDFIAAGILDPASAGTARPMTGTAVHRGGATASATPGVPLPPASQANTAAGPGTPPPPPSVGNAASASPGSLLIPPASDSAYQATASYYGVDDGAAPGKMMACGAPFDPNSTHSAATNDWPCGTKLKVTAADGRNLDVVVADHGQYPSRWIDLTYAAFGLIADHRSGVVQVTVQVAP